MPASVWRDGSGGKASGAYGVDAELVTTLNNCYETISPYKVGEAAEPRPVGCGPVVAPTMWPVPCQAGLRGGEPSVKK